MATSADIRACLGERAARYAANKHKGGSNGNKGTRYEDFFIAYKVVEQAVSLLSDPEGPNPHVQGQGLGFVDDVRLASDDATAYFQLKNKVDVRWLVGEHPIVRDFEDQFTLSRYLREPRPSTNLVVPTHDLATTLAADMPVQIRDHTQVHHFPWTVTANRLVLECPELRTWLAELAPVEEPTDDVLTGIFGAMQMACLEYPAGATVRDVVDRAGRLFPCQLRLLPAAEDWERHLDPGFRQVLDGIPGLVYGARRGVFHWTAFGTTGIFGSAVLSDEFRQFQNVIIQSAPATLDAFEEVLP